MLQQARLVTTIGRIGGSVEQELDIASEQILYWLGRSVVSLFMQTMLRTDVRLHAPPPRTFARDRARARHAPFSPGQHHLGGASCLGSISPTRSWPL